MFSLPANATVTPSVVADTSSSQDVFTPHSLLCISHHQLDLGALEMSRSGKWDVLKALRNQCEALDLSTTGNQAELDDRIKRKEEVTEITTTRSTPQYAAVEAIVAKKVVVKDVLEGELAYLEEETNRWGNEEELLQL